MLINEVPAPAATTVVVDIRWENGVALTLPAANTADYRAFAASLEEFDPDAR